MASSVARCSTFNSHKSALPSEKGTKPVRILHCEYCDLEFHKKSIHSSNSQYPTCE